MAIFIYTGLSLLFFQRFEKQFIPQNTRRKVKRNQLQKLSNQYDFFIVGSDQIWNTQSLPHVVDDTYFLDFCKDKRKKISYAASIGLPDFPENDKSKVTDYLNDFNCLSVREPQAQDVIERLIGRRPTLVVDPTLLLNCKMWEELAIKPSMDKYVFLYLRHKNSEVVPYAKALANKLGLKIVEYHSGIRKIYSDDKLLIHPEPRKWLGWLLNAKYVFTDSFHGSIFCINCNKQFFVKVSSANAEMSSRIYHILDRYGMMSRLIEDEQKMLAMPDIDFSKSNAMLMQDREDALCYLRKALDIK